nr:hypothetical protein [Chlamydiota bacterium]
GHLFQGRFKSILIDSDRYQKELIRYIHLNPIRAGMVGYPEDYKWSSHNTYLGTDPVLWINSDYVLRRFSDLQLAARGEFQNFVRSAIGVPEEVDFEKGAEEGILGDDDFVAMVREKAELIPEICLSIAELTQEICDHYNVDLGRVMRSGKERHIAKVRGILALMVRETEELTLEALGRYLGRDANGLSRQAARLTSKSLSSEELFLEIDQIREHLIKMSECPA